MVQELGSEVLGPLWTHPWGPSLFGPLAHPLSPGSLAFISYTLHMDTGSYEQGKFLLKKD